MGTKPLERKGCKKQSNINSKIQEVLLQLLQAGFSSRVHYLSWAYLAEVRQSHNPPAQF